MLSLATNPACLLMDDELNILPTSSHVRRCAADLLGSRRMLSSAIAMLCVACVPLLCSGPFLIVAYSSGTMLQWNIHCTLSDVFRRCTTSSRCPEMRKVRS